MEIALYFAFLFLLVFGAPITIGVAIVWFWVFGPKREPHGFEVKTIAGQTPVLLKERDIDHG